MTASQLKKDNPDLYDKIIVSYGGREKIFDITAAINLYNANLPIPVCEICGKQVSITKKFRDIGLAALPCRCKTHINSSHPITIAQLHSANRYGYILSDVVEEALSSSSSSSSLSSKITLTCQTHGDFKQPISNFLKGYQCQKCAASSRPLRTEVTSWIAESMALHSSKYDYSKVKFTKLTDMVTIICPIHGEFTQSAGVHKLGHGCQKCGNDIVTAKNRISNEEYIEKCKKKHGDLYDYSQTNYVSILHSKVKIICKKHGEFWQRPGDHLNNGNGCPQCGIEKTTFKSAAEYEIIEWLTSVGVTNIQHSWRGLGFEIDIYLPDYKVAIEYNGIYWHSSDSIEDDPVKSTQHLFKTEKCEDNGIHLLHILDVEWNDSNLQDIWKSTILHKLKRTTHKIYARQCNIVLVTNKVATKFFTENHLQGAVIGSLSIGLSYMGELVSVGTFAKSRYRTKQKNIYEILRFSSKKYYSVIGGFSKIIKEFDATHRGTLISYANRRWSMGNVYEQSGFTLAYKTDPCYYYTDCKTLWHRSIFQKHKLKDAIAVFDEAKTEVVNMYENKYRRIWDCGQMVYERVIK